MRKPRLLRDASRCRTKVAVPSCQVSALRLPYIAVRAATTWCPSGMYAALVSQDTSSCIRSTSPLRLFMSETTSSSPTLAEVPRCKRSLTRRAPSQGRLQARDRARFVCVSHRPRHLQRERHRLHEPGVHESAEVRGQVGRRIRRTDAAVSDRQGLSQFRPRGQVEASPRMFGVDEYTEASGDVDDRGTPWELFLALHEEFGFSIDVASSHSNAKLVRHWTQDDDGLAQSW